MHGPGPRRRAHPLSRPEQHAQLFPRPILLFARTPACAAVCSFLALASHISPAGARECGDQLGLPWKGDTSEESKQGGNAVQPFGATPGEDQAQSSRAEQGLSQAVIPAPPRSLHCEGVVTQKTRSEDYM